MKTASLTCLALFTMTGLAAPAMAQFVNSRFVNVDPKRDMSYSITDPTVMSGTTSAGLFNWQGTVTNPVGLQGNYWAFCIELTQHVSGNTNYFGNNYRVRNLEDAPRPTNSVAPMGSQKADALRELFGRFFFPAFGPAINGPGITQDEAAAMQVAIWEIVYETASAAGSGTPGAAYGQNWGLSTGNAVFTGRSQVLTLATSFLNALDGTGRKSYDLYAVSSENNQDMIVPTPGAMALLGVAGVAASRRRRR